MSTARVSKESAAAAARDELGWLRALATRLAGASQADDAVQDTWVAASAAAASPRSRRAWLTTILRNTVRMSMRSASRRARRERSMPAVEQSTTVEAQAHAAEVLTVLRQQVAHMAAQERQLLEFRATGITASEVGRLLGIPEATARTRTHRLLKKLRLGLDEHYGGRERWVPAFALVPDFKPVLGVVMMTLNRVLIAAAIVGMAVAAYGWSRGASTPAPGAQPEAAAAAAAEDRSKKPLRVARAANPKIDRIREARRARLGFVDRIDAVEDIEAAEGEAADACDDGCIATIGLQVELAQVVSGCREDLPKNSRGKARFRAHVLAEPGFGAAVDAVEILEDSIGDAAFLECIAQSAPLAELNEPSGPVSASFAFRYLVNMPSDPASEFLNAHPDLVERHPELAAIAARPSGKTPTTEELTAFARLIADDTEAQATFARWAADEGLDLAKVRVD